MYRSVNSRKYFLNGLLTAVSRGWTRPVQPPGIKEGMIFASRRHAKTSSVVWNAAASKIRRLEVVPVGLSTGISSSCINRKNSFSL